MVGIIFFRQHYKYGLQQGALMMIRLARSEDVPAIRNCARAAYQKYVALIGREPAPMVADFGEQVRSGRVHIFERSGDGVCAFIVFYPRGDHMHLENIAVRPDCHGQGLGRQLIAYCENAARSTGMGTVELYTNEKMTENLSFYPALGYKEISRRTEDGFHRVYFRKELSDG